MSSESPALTTIVARIIEMHRDGRASTRRRSRPRRCWRSIPERCRCPRFSPVAISLCTRLPAVCCASGSTKTTRMATRIRCCRFRGSSSAIPRSSRGQAIANMCCSRKCSPPTSPSTSHDSGRRGRQNRSMRTRSKRGGKSNKPPRRFRRRREKPLELAAPSQPPRHPWRAGWHFGASDLYLVSRQRRPAERRPRISPQLPACS